MSSLSPVIYFKVIWLYCNAAFEIDDRGECVYADLDNLRFPGKGSICSVCVLLQRDENESCF